MTLTAPLTAPVPWRVHPAHGEEGMAHLIDANGNTVAIGPEGTDAILHAAVAAFVVEAVNGAENTPQTYMRLLADPQQEEADDDE